MDIIEWKLWNYSIIEVLCIRLRGIDYSVDEYLNLMEQSELEKLVVYLWLVGLADELEARGSILNWPEPANCILG